MSALNDIIHKGTAVPAHNPCTRTIIDAIVWRQLAELLSECTCTLMALWGESAAVHMALKDTEQQTLAVFTLECPDGHFPSIGQFHPPAIRLERTIFDLYALRVERAPDIRPWLDHGCWANAESAPRPYTFLPVEGDSLHEIPVGPVHAGIIEPGHFRFTASGETVVRLEERLGYVHKGIESLMSGAALDRGAQLAGRTSGDSTVAYGWAFARAAEAALGFDAPPRAIWLRALMAELERLANHLGDIGAICNDASFALMHAHCGVLRERVLRAADTCFGHRLMRDRIIPGGVTTDLTREGNAALQAMLAEIQRRFPALIELYDNTASLQDRTVNTGILTPKLARQFAPGGYIGRASGRDFDSRRDVAYPPYDRLSFTVPVLEKGDVDARVWIRIREVEQSLLLIGQILDELPDSPLAAALPTGGGEGLGIVEAFRGDVLVWLRLRDDGVIDRCHLRDASWFQWPLLEAVIEGNIVADFPLCNKSFNCSYSGHDL